jgi:hypothetical protein
MFRSGGPPAAAGFTRQLFVAHVCLRGQLPVRVLFLVVIPRSVLLDAERCAVTRNLLLPQFF